MAKVSITRYTTSWTVLGKVNMKFCNLMQLDKSLLAPGIIMLAAEILSGLQNNYGKDHEAAIHTIKELYKELKLEEAFREYEQASYQKLCSDISKQDQLPEGVFKLLLNKIYKRSK